jgi:XTP/dITP diphosphohydrolase
VPKLLLATSNPGKQREFRFLLGASGWEIITPQELRLSLPDEEKETDYTENAIIKAENAARASGLTSLADDSGVEVDALNGVPGVLSARFGGPGLDDRGRLDLMLERLANVPDEERTARYRAVIAVVRPDVETMTFEGICEGVIGREPVGDGGFGYDPIFYIPNKGKTMAELTMEEKNEISHRAVAAKKAVEFLKSLARGSTVTP